MLRKFLLLAFATFCLLGLCATPVLANEIDTASLSWSCSAYSLSVSASDLIPGTNYTIEFTWYVDPPGSGFPPVTSIPFTATSTTFSDTVTGAFPLSGYYEFGGGSATLVGGGVTYNTIEVSISPQNLTCPSTPPPPPCSAQSTNSSNFNGTSIPAGDYIWFNANFTASGIPSTGATITLTNSTISFTAAGTAYSLPVPNAQITFSPSATCTSTTYNSMTGTWMTTVPIKGDDEIFLTGLAFPVPAGGLPGGINPVDWQGTFGTGGTSGISIQWKWGAAVYSSFTTDYNALAVKPGHQTACGQSNGDHAGTPEGVNSNNQPWKNFVIGGSRGGGGSNWTGSWSGTVSVVPMCQSSSLGTLPRLELRIGF